MPDLRIGRVAPGAHPCVRIVPFVISVTLAACIPRDLTPIHPCVTSTVAKRIAVTGVNEVDLLLVVDDSSSMREEQALLQAQFPRLIEGLVTGDSDGDPDTPSYPPVASLRVAVVSSDLGIGRLATSTVSIAGCNGPSDTPAHALVGDDGVFNRSPVGADAIGDPSACDGADPDTMPDTLDQASLPTFLTFDAEGETEEATFADRIACYAMLGVRGCGFEQQLESMLKSVTPSTSETKFLAPAGSPTSAEHGQGDRANAGWLREDALLAVLMITDEDDCSAASPLAFDFTATGDYSERLSTGQKTLSRANTRCVRFGDEVVPGNPNGNQDLSLNTLQPPSRYVDGLIALKGGDADNVVFALITGVPPETVDDPASGEGSENLDAVLAHPSMDIEFVGTGENAYGGIAFSCTVCLYGFPNCDIGFNDVDGDGDNAPDCFDLDPEANGVCDPGEALRCTKEINGIPGCQIDETEVSARTRAVPPRRLVRTAQAMHEAGAHVIVQSICQPDFSDAMNAILERISSGLATACVPRALVRNGEGRVACQVVERLPVGQSCSARPGRTLRGVGEDAREICEVGQLAVPAGDRMAGIVPTEAGWFYDDFTERTTACPAQPTRQRISFSDAGTPEGRVVLTLECDQPVPGDLVGADIGRECSPSGTQCEMTEDELATFVLQYNLPGTYTEGDRPLVCEPQSNTCQITCLDDASCPPGYACYEAFPGTSVCVNPTCPLVGGVE